LKPSQATNNSNKKIRIDIFFIFFNFPQAKLSFEKLQDEHKTKKPSDPFRRLRTIIGNSLRQHYLDQVQQFASHLEASQPGIAQAPVKYSIV
jgi:hypothetical protein